MKAQGIEKREKNRASEEREYERVDERKSSTFWFNLGKKGDGNMSYEKQEERKVDERVKFELVLRGMNPSFSSPKEVTD